jgi:hypothetical protein
MKRVRTKKKKPTAWQRSAAFRIQADAALRKYNAGRHLLPKCGAMARSTGQPCRATAMGNGRCYRHGGKTPAGAQWHKVQWPEKDAPGAMEKLGAKLKKNAKTAREKTKRLGAMSSEARAAHETWQRTHAAGSIKHRQAVRQRGAENDTAREIFSKPRPVELNPSLLALVDRIAELKALQAGYRQPSVGIDILTFRKGVFE